MIDQKVMITSKVLCWGSPSLRRVSLGLAMMMVLAGTTSAQATDLLVPLAAQDPASSGATSVAVEGVQSAEKVPAESKDATSLNISAGALVAAGNSKSLAVTGSADTRVRRGNDQGKAVVAANYAKSGNQELGNALEVTVENYQGNIRYDRFINATAPFLSVSARHDRFQGLDIRLNIDPGLAYYFMDRPKLQFWGEFGYDLQHDVRTNDSLDVAASVGTPVEKTETRHNARAYVGYNNEVNAFVTFKTGVEYLQAFVDPENYRLNWDLGVSSKLGGSFSMATTVSVKYDHNPLPEVERTDVVTAINLVYGLL